MKAKNWILIKQRYTENFLSASKEEYQKWLDGWMKQGNKPTHYYFDFPYNYPFPPIIFFKATQDFTCIPLYGLFCINIIVLENIQIFDIKNKGHMNLYFMKDFKHSGFWIPIFNDMEK